MAKKATTTSARGTDTRQRVVEVARAMMQERGYNGFSYSEVAAAVGVSHVAIHHHFKAKADLGAATMADYGEQFAEALAEVDQRHADAPARLRAFVDLFRQVLRDGDRVCLCGMLASEYPTLPGPVQQEVRAFFERNEEWLAHLLEEGRAGGAFTFDGKAGVVAASFLASLEGALIAARTFGDERRFIAAGKWLVSGLMP